MPKRDLYDPNGSGDKPFLLIRTDAHPFRKVQWYVTTVRHDDEPWRCLACRRVVRVGQEVMVRRSSHETTPGCFGPIECAVHGSCWLLLTLDRDNRMPELGPKGARMERYDDSYPWAGKW
jgi:hypothetical protein